MKTTQHEEFLLNMQILADVLEDSYNILKFVPQKNRPLLKTIRYYRNGITPSLDNVYILWAFQVNEQFAMYQDVSLIIIGEVDTTLLSASTSYIVLSENSDIDRVYDYITDVFLKYTLWNLALQRAHFSDSPLQEMLQASVDIFKNPIFVHDSDFYVLACPNRVDGMTEFMIDSRNGRPMITLDLINAYKIDEEYLGTLSTYGPQMFYANPRNYRILYMNLWNGNHYEGRICINELQTLIKPGDYLALEHLSKIIVNFITHRNVFWTTLGQDAEILCRKVLDRTITDDREISRTLRFLNWSPYDTYLIIKLGTGPTNSDSHFSTGTFGYIESQIAASHAFFYDQSIVVIVNQTVGKASTAQIVSDMAYLLREGLFKMGVSNEINDFTQIHIGYHQASIALEFGALSESTSWCYHLKIMLWITFSTKPANP